MSEKSKRPPSIMGDDERATQPRVSRTPPSGVPSVTSGEVTVPHEDFDSLTPPPIVVDDIGRPVAGPTTRVSTPKSRRDRRTVQEVTEELWPARKALPMLMEQLQRIVALETKVEELDERDPSHVTTAAVDKLRAELIGVDGKGGVVGKLEVVVQRDLERHRAVVDDVEARATRDAKFVRRVLISAGGLVAGSIVGAVLLIYQAGAKSESSKAEQREQRREIMYRIDSLDATLTDLRGQVKLLIESQLRGSKPP